MGRAGGGVNVPMWRGGYLCSSPGGPGTEASGCLSSAGSELPRCSSPQILKKKKNETKKRCLKTFVLFKVLKCRDRPTFHGLWRQEVDDILKERRRGKKKKKTPDVSFPQTEHTRLPRRNPKKPTAEDSGRLNDVTHLCGPPPPPPPPEGGGGAYQPPTPAGVRRQPRPPPPPPPPPRRRAARGARRGARARRRVGGGGRPEGGSQGGGGG